MKTKLFLFVITLFAGSVLFAQNTDQDTSDCDRKVLKKIRKTMNYIDVKDYVEEGQRNYVVLTCNVDENNYVVAVSATGVNEQLNTAVIQNLEEHQVTCENHPTGKPFTILLTFRHIPWDNF